MDKVLVGKVVKAKKLTAEEVKTKDRKIDRYLKVIAIVLTILGAITFTEFIFEEALQQVGMSCFILRSVGTADEVRECGVVLREEGEKFKGFVEKIGPLNPLTYKAFLKYANSTITQGRAYEKLGDYKDPRNPKVSLPYDSEDEKQEYLKAQTRQKSIDEGCVENGTSCHLLKGWGE